MSIGEALLGEAFEAMGWPWRRVQRSAAWLLLASALAFPLTFHHALMAYANREAQAVLHQLQKALPRQIPSPASR